MLLEQGGMETPKILKPFEDFIPFFSRSDCFDKAKYYLRNNTEREEISLNGFLKYQKLFSSQRFWFDIFEYLEDLKKRQLSSSLKSSPQGIGGDDFWNQSILCRSIPYFNPLQYQNFNKYIVIYYRLLDRVMVKPYFYLLYRCFCQCIEYPRRILIKLKKIVLTRTLNK